MKKYDQRKNNTNNSQAFSIRMKYYISQFSIHLFSTFTVLFVSITEHAGKIQSSIVTNQHSISPIFRTNFRLHLNV